MISQFKIPRPSEISQPAIAGRNGNYFQVERAMGASHRDSEAAGSISPARRISPGIFAKQFSALSTNHQLITTNP